MGKKYSGIPYSDDLIEAVLALLKSNPNLTCQQIANVTNRPYNTINKLRRYLRKSGLLPDSKGNGNNERVIYPLEQIKTEKKQTKPINQKKKKPLTLRERFILIKKMGLL
jgi:transposase